MQITRLALMLIFLLHAAASAAADGMIAMKSPYSAAATMDRLENQVRQRGLIVFARIDHAAGAAKVGRSLRPTALLIFGHPKGGTPFMECQQTVGIDLPLKMLVWEDANAQVWLAYNDPAFIARRHGVAHCPVIEKMQTNLNALAHDTVER